MNDLKRVFFHELGHFVAHEINRTNYNGPDIKSFTVSLYEETNQLYEGEVKIDLLCDKNEPPSSDRQTVPQILASLIYGSFFQAYFTNTSLNEAINRNGRHDLSLWREYLWINNIYHCASELKRTEDEHFELMRHSKCLEQLLSLSCKDYVLKVEGRHKIIDLDALRVATNFFIKEHTDLYSSLIEKYKQTIDKCF